MSYRITTPWGQIIDTDLEVRRVVQVVKYQIPNNIYVLYNPEEDVIYVPQRDLARNGKNTHRYSAYMINNQPFNHFESDVVVLSNEKYSQSLQELNTQSDEISMLREEIRRLNDILYEKELIINKMLSRMTRNHMD